MKKIFPYIFLGAGLIVLIILLNNLHHREELGIKLTHPKIIGLGALAVVLISIGISMILKRI